MAISALPFGQSALLPSGVLVTFPVQYCDNTPIPANNPPAYSQTVELNSLTGFTALTGSVGVKIIHDTCPALMATGASSTPNNAADLTALAKQIATDYYAWISVGFNYVFNGVNLWDVTAYADEIIVHYERDQIRTMVSTAQWTGYPEELQHTDNPNCSSSASGSQSASSSGSGSGSSSGSASGSQSASSPSPSASQSQYPCPPNNGIYAYVSDIQCVGGQLLVYKQDFEFNNGVQTCVIGPYYSHTAGCCNCPASGSQSASSVGSAASGNASQSAGPSTSQSMGSQSACPCPCIGKPASLCFYVDVNPLLTADPCTIKPQQTGIFTLYSDYHVCSWSGHDYGNAWLTTISFVNCMWQMTVGTFGTPCYWVLTSSNFNCCTGGYFTTVSGPTSGIVSVNQGGLDPNDMICKPTSCHILWS